MAVWYPELFFLGALRAQKFTFRVPESQMAMTSLFIGVAGNSPFHTPQSNWLGTITLPCWALLSSSVKWT